MKVFIVTDRYATCDKCDAGARSGDPLLKFGQFVEWVTLHKSCFDTVTKGVEEMVVGWHSRQTPPSLNGGLPRSKFNQ